MSIDAIEAVPPEPVRWEIRDGEAGSVSLAITVTGGLPRRLLEVALNVRVRSGAEIHTARIVLRAMGPAPDGESGIDQ